MANTIIDSVTMNDRRLCVGDIVRHFKYETLTEEEKETFKYLYKIKCFAIHTEQDLVMVVYQALYDDKIIYVRPVNMFMSEVDREKYPDIKQKYRFEIM